MEGVFNGHIAGPALEHLLRLVACSHQAFRTLLKGNHRRLVQYDSLT